jgi:hypothetical protein
MRPVERLRAIELRQSGMSIRSISATLGCSKGSVSGWVRDVELSAAQKTALEKLNPANASYVGQSFDLSQVRRRGGHQRSIDAKLHRQAFQAIGRHRASEAPSDLFIKGCMLYWGEGAKSRNSAKMTNSDPYLLRVFVSFLRECFGVTSDRLSVYVKYYPNNLHSIGDTEGYWLELFGLRRNCLRKTAVVCSEPKRKGTIHEYGLCEVVIHSTDIVQQIFGAIKHFGGISDDRWL